MDPVCEFLHAIFRRTRKKENLPVTPAAQQLSDGPVRNCNSDTPLSPKLFSILLEKASTQALKVLDQVADRFGMVSGSVLQHFLSETKIIIGGSAALLALHPDLDFSLQNIDLYALVLS